MGRIEKKNEGAPRRTNKKPFIKKVCIGIIGVVVLVLALNIAAFVGERLDLLWTSVIEGDKRYVKIEGTDRYEVEHGHGNKTMLRLKEKYLVNFRLDDEDEIREAEEKCLLAFPGTAFRFGEKKKRFGEMLLERGYDINAHRCYGPHKSTPLQEAVKKGDPELTMWLIEKGADPHVRFGDAVSPMYEGIEGKTLLEGAQWLAKDVANWVRKDPEIGKDPSFEELKEYKQRTIEVLLNHAKAF